MLMKKFILCVITLAGALTAQAKALPQPLIETEDSKYAYLTFETTDGAKASVSVSSLSLSINGNTLTAGSKSFVISNLSKMYFSATDESNTTGISQMEDKDANFDDSTEIYDLQGKKIKKDQVKKGAYIVKKKDKTYKIVVR